MTPGSDLAQQQRLAASSDLALQQRLAASSDLTQQQPVLGCGRGTDIGTRGLLGLP